MNRTTMQGERLLVATALLGLAAGCAKTELDDSRHPTGSQAMVTSTDRKALYVTNVHNDSVTRVDITTGTADELMVGAEPTRITRAGEHVFVTLRAERNIAVLREGPTGLTFEQKIEVGAEPYAVVANEDGDRVFASISQTGEVVRIDPATMTVVARWSVQGEPRWMALHPNGRHLYVASAMQPLLTTIDTEADVVEVVTIPNLDFGGSNRPARITGDPAVSPDGEYIAVPTLHLDNETPIDDESTPPPGGYYGGRFGPTVVTMPVSRGTAEVNRSLVNALSQNGSLLGYASSVTYSPNGEQLYVSIEGAEGIMALDLRDPENDDSVLEAFFVGTDDGVVDGASRTLNFKPTVAMTDAPAGPRSVVFADEDRAFTYGFIDREVFELPTETVSERIEFADAIAFSTPESLSVGGAGMQVSTAPTPFTPGLQQGLELFYSTTDARVSSGGSGLSCATCHFEGRDDGLSWTFLRGRRQTPSLAGQVSLTEPVRWEGDRVTVEEDAARTSREAMGGEGMTQTELENMAGFIDWIRDVDIARGAMDDPAIARGQAIFEREDVGCADCHNGQRLTDNQSYNVMGRTMQTRSLVGLKATAPYMHDGSLPTLADVVEMSTTGNMGDTSMLSDAEKADLVRYLETL